MFNKFEAFMNKWLMPIAQKVDKQRHLSAIKASMVAMTPFTILGSFFAIIPALPNMIGENNAFSQFILNNAELLDLPVTLSIGMMSVYVTMCIAYNLGNHYKLYIRRGRYQHHQLRCKGSVLCHAGRYGCYGAVSLL